MADDKHWTKFTHPAYDDRISKWSIAGDMYEADFKTLRNPSATSEYLIQRKQGESNEQHQERKENADFLPLFGTVTDAMAGRIGAKEPETERTWQAEDTEEGLGDPTDSGDLAGRLWENANGKGDNYLTVLQDAAIELITKHWVWCIAEGVIRDGRGTSRANTIGEPSFRILTADSVRNWRWENGRLVEVVLKHEKDTRTSIQDEPEMEEQYRVYDLEGYQDWRENDQAEMVPASAKRLYGGNPESPFQYYETERRERPILPIFRTHLSLKRHVGSIWAEKNKIIFNKESERDNLLTIANTPRLVLFATYEQYKDQIKKGMKDGGNVLLADPEQSSKHDYIAPPTDPARLATDVLEEKVQNFFISAFRSYENAVRAGNRTATEVRHQQAMGEETFLSTLATALDELEKNSMWRMEQIYFPNSPNLWGQFSAERPRDFSPLDEEAVAQSLTERYFPDGPVPVGTSGRTQAAMKIAENDEIQPDDNEVQSSVERQERKDEIDLQRMEQALRADEQRLNGTIEQRRRSIEQAANNGE